MTHGNTKIKYNIHFVENVHCYSLTLLNKQRYQESLYQPLRKSDIHASILLNKQVFEAKKKKKKEDVND